MCKAVIVELADKVLGHLVFCLCSQVLGGLGNLPGPPGHVVQVEQGVDDEEQVPGVGGGGSHGGDGAQVDGQAGQAPELLGSKGAAGGHSTYLRVEQGCYEERSKGEEEHEGSEGKGALFGDLNDDSNVDSNHYDGIKQSK